MCERSFKGREQTANTEDLKLEELGVLCMVIVVSLFFGIDS